LGENDFGGLLYLLIEGVLLILTCVMVLTSLAANVRAATHPDTKHMATIRIFFTILAAAVLVVGFRFPTATKSLDDHFAKRQESAFMELLNDPFHLSAAVLLIAIGVYHLTLSSRVLIGRCTQPSPSVHLILLFAGLLWSPFSYSLHCRPPFQASSSSRALTRANRSDTPCASRRR